MLPHSVKIQCAKLELRIQLPELSLIPAFSFLYVCEAINRQCRFATNQTNEELNSSWASYVFKAQSIPADFRKANSADLCNAYD